MAIARGVKEQSIPPSNPSAARTRDFCGIVAATQGAGNVMGFPTEPTVNSLAVRCLRKPPTVNREQ
jgi:hypothetical protein